MTAEHVFSFANLIAVAGWLLLIILGRKTWVSTLAAGVVVPLLFAALYTTLLIAYWSKATGGFEVRDAQRHRIPHWAIIPSLILTFLFGPIGLLLYFLIRILRVRKVNIETHFG